jgi:quinol monooxygenase YgiN
MRYIQLVEFRSTHPSDEVRQVLDEWLAATRGKRTLETAIVAVEHEQPNHYWELLEYPSEAEAVAARELPETKAAYDRWIALVDGEPVFRNLDVVEQVEG